MKRSNSLFGRILYRYIAVAIVFFISISGIVGYSIWRSLDYKAKEGRLEDVFLAQQSFDGILKRTMNGMNYIANDNEFLKYGLTERNDQANVINLMHSLTDMTVATGTDMYKLAIYKAGSGTVITEQTTESADIFFEENRLLWSELDDIDAYFSANNDSGYYVSNRTAEPYLLTAARYTFSNGTVVYFMALFDVSEILSVYTAADKEYMIINNGVNVYGSGKWIEKAEQKLQDGSIECVFVSSGRLISARRSEVFPGFVYVCSGVVQYEKISVLVLSLFPGLILIVFLLLIAVWDAKRLYEPIDNIKNILNRIRQEDDQKNELEFIQKLTAEIVQENIVLAEKLQDRNTLFRHKALIDFVYGNISDSRAEEVIKELGLHNGCAIAVLIEFSKVDELSDNPVDELYLSTRMQMYLRFQQILEDLQGYELANLNYKSFLVVSVGNSDMMVEEVMKRLVRVADDEFDMILTVAIGDKARQIQDLRISFSSAQYLMEYKYIVRRKSIITTDILKHSYKINYYYPMEMESNLIHYVVNGEKEKCKAVINSIIETNFEKLSLDYNTIVEFKFAIVATIKRCLQYVNRSAEDVFEEGTILYLELKQCDSPSILAKKITDLFERIIDSTDFDKTDENTLMAAKIRDYVYQHYSEDISLSLISEKFYLSEGYISKIFKKEFGINFKTCLNGYRVDKAKEIMLHERNVKINEVAARVGCNNPTTFLRMFKAYTGTSPKAFINDHIE